MRIALRLRQAILGQQLRGVQVDWSVSAAAGRIDVDDFEVFSDRPRFQLALVGDRDRHTVDTNVSRRVARLGSNANARAGEKPEAAWDRAHILQPERFPASRGATLAPAPPGESAVASCAAFRRLRSASDSGSCNSRTCKPAMASAVARPLLVTPVSSVEVVIAPSSRRATASAALYSGGPFASRAVSSRSSCGSSGALPGARRPMRARRPGWVVAVRRDSRQSILPARTVRASEPATT